MDKPVKFYCTLDAVFGQCKQAKCENIVSVFSFIFYNFWYVLVMP